MKKDGERLIFEYIVDMKIDEKELHKKIPNLGKQAVNLRRRYQIDYGKLRRFAS